MPNHEVERMWRAARTMTDVRRLAEIGHVMLDNSALMAGVTTDMEHLMLMRAEWIHLRITFLEKSRGPGDMLIG